MQAPWPGAAADVPLAVPWRGKWDKAEVAALLGCRGAGPGGRGGGGEAGRRVVCQ